MLGVIVAVFTGPISAVYVLGYGALALLLPIAVTLAVNAGLGVKPGLYTTPDKITSKAGGQRSVEATFAGPWRPMLLQFPTLHPSHYPLAPPNAAFFVAGLVVSYVALLLYMSMWYKLEAYFSYTPWLR